MSPIGIHEAEREIQRAEEHLLVLRERLRQETLAKSLPLQPPPDPEDLIQGYPWPSSRITKADMIRLTELRRITRKPITKLVHDAVSALYSLLARKTNLNIVPWHGEGGSLWYVVDAEAGTDDQPAVIATASSREDADAIARSLRNSHKPSPAANRLAKKRH